MAAEAEVLIVGNGGREDTIRRAIECSSEVGRVVVNADVIAGLKEFSGSKPDLVVIGPEAPLIAGRADWLREEGYTTFGVGRDAAEYEKSKAHATRMLQRHSIRHPQTFISRTLADDLAYLRDHSFDATVIKADGEAGGKGVVLPESDEEAEETVRGMRGGSHSGAGVDIINFQERYRGPEVSAMVIVGRHGQSFWLPLAQDHKRLGEGDTGPNTGGMGAYAPVPEHIVNAQQSAWIQETMHDSLEGMSADGTPYERGVLFGGLMFLDATPTSMPGVLEFGCRFGDPETQVQLPLLVEAGVDVYRLFRSAAEGDLEVPKVDFAKLGTSAVTVCLAAEGYPGQPIKGEALYGLDNLPPYVIAQLAAVKAGKTNGGRVLYVTSTGETLRDAAARAYEAIDVDRQGPESGKVGFAGMQFRRDIGAQAMRTV